MQGDLEVIIKATFYSIQVSDEASSFLCNKLKLFAFSFFQNIIETPRAQNAL